MVAAKIFVSSKGAPKQGDHQEKTNEKDKATQDTKSFSNKDSKSNGGKKKDRNGYKGPNVLTLEMMEKYQKEKRCFHCGEQGHSYCETVPRKRIPKILHKLPIFYLMERRKKKMVDALLCATYGERLEIKVLSSY